MDTTTISTEDKNMALITQLLGIAFSVVPGILFWLVASKDRPYVSISAQQALNFQINIAMGYIICIFLAPFFIGLILLPILIIFNVVFCIIAAVQARQGKPVTYLAFPILLLPVKEQVNP